MRAKEFVSRNMLFFSIVRMMLLVLIPTIALGGYTYFQARKSMQHNAETGIQRQLNTAVAEIETHLDELYNILSIITNDRQVSSMDLSGTPTTAAEVRKLLDAKNTTNLAISVDPLIREAYIYTGEANIVCTEGIFPAEYYLTEYRRLEGYTLEDYQQMLGSYRRITYLPPTTLHEKSTNRYTEQSVLPVVKNCYINNRAAVVVFLLDVHGLLDTVTKYLHYDSVYCTIVTKTGVLAADEKPEDVAYHQSTYASTHNGWHYTVYIPRAAVMATSHPMLVQVILMVGAMLLLCLLFILMVSRYLFLPLDKLQTLVEGGAASSMTLARLEQQVTDTVKRGADTRSRMVRLVKHYVNEAIRSQSITEKNAEVLQDLLHEYFDFRAGDYQCMALRIVPGHARAEHSVREVFARYMSVCSVMYDEQTLLLVLEAGSVHARSILDTAMKELFTQMPEKIIGVAVDEETVSCRQLSQSLNTCLTLLQHMDEDGFEQELYSNDFDISNHYIYTHKDELTLVEALQRNEADRLHSLLDKILLENYEKCVSYPQVQQLFAQLRNTAYRYAQQEHIQCPPYVYRHTPLLSVMRSEIHDLYAMLLASRETPANSPHLLLANAADAYIQAHYAEDVYLDVIAQELNVSAKHLSKVYKQIRNINITDQITYVRVEHAKELLRDTTKSISTIMEESGFQSRATFLRSIKKFTDISPSIYRQMHAQHVSLDSYLFQLDDAPHDDE